MLNFIKIRIEGAELHAGGRTDGHGKANNHFSQFCEHGLKNLYRLLEEEKIRF